MNYQSGVRCTSCGAALPAGSRFCSRCGKSMGADSGQKKAELMQQTQEFWENVEEEEKKNAKERRKVNIIYWLIRLIGFALLAYVVWQVALS